MNAEIFYLAEQENSLPLLKEILRTHIYSGLQVKLSKFEASSRVEDADDIGRRYAKLLLASIPPETGLKLSVKNLETFGHNAYIEVYYVLGYPAFRYGGTRIFREAEFIYFFPALAIRDRMVLIPNGLRNQLRTAKPEALPNPIEMGGVLDVDFQDETKVRDAIVQVGQRLRSDFTGELRAYASYQNLKEIDLPKLAQDLGVDPGFIQHSLKTEAVEALFYQKLTCRFDREKIPLKRWTKVNLIIRNDSDAALSDLEVEISGPAQIRPTRLQTGVPAHSSAQLPLAIMPDEAGDFPLEITFALPTDKLLVSWLPVHHIWLQCE
ncbi:MAG: hypothetical protein MUO77_09390 [Anaerolineales bacterium]|nr:hypothetical protein [Anaerolineales bacterium]